MQTRAGEVTVHYYAQSDGGEGAGAGHWARVGLSAVAAPARRPGALVDRVAPERIGERWELARTPRSLWSMTQATRCPTSSRTSCAPSSPNGSAVSSALPGWSTRELRERLGC